MPERSDQLPISQEDIENAHTYVDRIKRRVERGQLTDKHLQQAGDYLTSVGSQIRRPPIELRQGGQVIGLRVGIAADIPPKDEEEKNLPKILVDNKNRRVQIPEYEITARIRGKVDWATFGHFAHNPNRDIPKEDLLNAAFKAGSKAKSPKDIILRLRKALEPDPRNPTVITTRKTDEGPVYRLYAQVEFLEEKGQPKEKTAKPIEPALIPGETDKERYLYRININSRMVSVINQHTNEASHIQDHTDFNLLVKLLMADDTSLKAAEVAEFQRIHGDSRRTAAVLAIARLRSLVKDDRENPQIITKSGGYRYATYHFKGDFELTRDDLDTEPPEKPESAPPITSPTAPKPSFGTRLYGQTTTTDELAIEPAAMQPTELAQIQASAEQTITPRYVPYEASEEEKRSTDEDKVLSVVSAMIIRGHRITFEALQTALHTTDRIGQDSRGPYVKGYPAAEIIEKFESGFMKIREEAEIVQLRQLWTEKDHQIWQSLQTLLVRHGRDAADLIKKVKEEVNKAQRRFKRDNSDPNFDINRLRLRQ